MSYFIISCMANLGIHSRGCSRDLILGVVCMWGELFVFDLLLDFLEESEDDRLRDALLGAVGDVSDIPVSISSSEDSPSSSEDSPSSERTANLLEVGVGGLS